MRATGFAEEVTDSDIESGGHVVEVDSQLKGRESNNEDLVRSHQGVYSLPSRECAVLETNKAPTLRTADRKDILIFQQKREKYERVHFEAGLDRIRMRSLVSMFEPVFLEAVCQYHIGKSIIEVTDKELDEWMSSVLRDDKSRDVLLDQKMGKLRMRMSIGSAGARVLDLIVQFQRVVKENGWERLFLDPEGKKRQVKFLMNAVEPRGLRSMMMDRVQREAHLSKDPTAFIKLLQEVAVYYQETSLYQRTDSAAPNAGHKRQKVSRPPTFEVKLGGNKRTVENKGYTSQQYKKQAKLRCYACNEVGHPVHKCPKNLSKQEVFDILKSNKKGKGSDYALVCSIGIEENSNEVLVRINESLYFAAILDSGARGVSLIPRIIANRAMQSDPSITL